MKDIGYIHFVTNPAMPGLSKIGFTRGPLEERLKQLSTSGVPQPFELGAAFRVYGPSKCEREIHSLLKRHRVNRDREFFQVALSFAVSSAMPVLAARLSENGAPADADGVTSEVVEAADEFALQMLAHDYPEGGTVNQLIDGGHPDHSLELRLRLIGLSEKGLVEERGNRGLTIVWRLTNKGLKYIFQKGIVIKELIKDEKELNIAAAREREQARRP